MGAADFAVLPNVSAGATAALVLAAMAPALIRLWRRPLPSEFGDAAAYACLCSFVFGYHVHEKAVLMVRGHHKKLCRLQINTRCAHLTCAKQLWVRKAQQVAADPATSNAAKIPSARSFKCQHLRIVAQKTTPLAQAVETRSKAVCVLMQTLQQLRR